MTPNPLEPRICGARFAGTSLLCEGAPVRGDDGTPRNGRCAIHGGLSSGPKTREGRARVSAAVRQRHRCERLFRLLATALLQRQSNPLHGE